MAGPPPDPHISHPHRAWRDAERCYRSYWFIAPVALLATAAAVASVLVPAETSESVKVILAVASASGMPFGLGAIVLIRMLIFAPERRERDEIRQQVQIPGLQSQGAETSKTIIFAPRSTFIMGEEGSVKGQLEKPEEKEGP